MKTALLVTVFCLLAAAGLGAAADCSKLRACSSTLLKKGSKGSCVRAMQSVVGTAADGDFGPKTDAAVKAFQRSKGLVVDGQVGPKTWGAILRANCASTPPAAAGLGAVVKCINLRVCSSTLLKKGSKGSCVRAVQLVVGTTADGDFGSKTDAAVKAFQRSKGLVADGQVGPKTWGAILRANCASTPPAPSQYGNFRASRNCDGISTPVLPAVQATIRQGAASYGKTKTSFRDKVLARAWKSNAKVQATGAKLIYPHAADALGHFVDQSGTFLSFNARDMVSQSVRANDCFVKDANLLRAAAEALVPPGQTKCLTNINEEVPRSASANVCNPSRSGGVSKTSRGDFDWHAAVGGYRTATQATVSCSGRVYTARIAYSIRDYYDWDPKDTGHVGLVTPNQMYALHVWGWAKNFEQGGIYTVVHQWTKGQRMSYK